MKSYFALFLLLITTGCFAGTADTVAIHSNAMQKTYKAVVIKPDNYASVKEGFETVYLLHGHSGNFSNWITRVPELKEYADRFKLIIVCPEGSFAGWYFDSPLMKDMQFETFVAKEVPAFIEANYHTKKSRYARAITGLSMGGHGGLYLGFRHADYFGACGSMSGALLIDQIKDNKYGISKLLGDTSNTALYRKHSIMSEMETYPKDSLAVIIDCGTEDFIVGMSRLVHNRMLELKIPHDYTERPGSHNWKYWSTAVEYQLLFFRNYFDRNVGRK